VHQDVKPDGDEHGKRKKVGYDFHTPNTPGPSAENEGREQHLSGDFFHGGLADKRARACLS
jgi:hypothetical protein